MVETYGSDEERVYYVAEDTFGTTPTNPTMLSVPADQIEPSIDPGNIKLRGRAATTFRSSRKALGKWGLR